MVLSNLISVVVVLALLGLCVWLIEKYVPMPEIFHTAIRIVVVVGVVLYLLTWLGVWRGLPTR